MKQFYKLAFALLLLWGTSAMGQTILLDQDFEAGNLPAGWSRQQNTPSQGWVFGTSATLSSSNLTFPAHTKFAASNDDKYDNQSTTANRADRDMLITPTLNLTTLGAARLAFSAYHTGAFGSTATVEISTDGGATWSSIYTIPGTNEWQNLSVDLTPYLAYSNVKLAFVHNDGGGWSDGVGVDDVTVFEPTQNDIQLLAVNVPASTSVGSVPVSVTIRNYGISTLNSFTFEWSTDNFATTHTDLVNGLGLAPGASKTIVHNSPLGSATHANLTLIVRTRLPNGQTDPTPNNSDTATVEFVLGTADKHVLVEQHTGSWCQFCPDGAVVLASILDSFPEVIAIAIHNDDAMAFGNGNTVANSFVGGFPAGTVDRVLFTGESRVGMSRGQWKSRTALRRSAPAQVFIEADNTYDPATRQLTVNVSAKFLAALSGEYRLNVFIVEDSVTGTGSGYNQVNAYNNTSTHPYYRAGNPIVGFLHRHVGRHFMGGAWGQTGVIPVNNIVPLSPYSHTFTYTLPAGWNANRVTLIAVVQEYGAQTSKRQIMNALQLDLNTAAAHHHDVVANPVVLEVINIAHNSCGGGTNGEIDIQAVGCADCDFVWSSGHTGPLIWSLPSGSYTVTVSNASGVSLTHTYTVYGPINPNPTINNNGNVTLNVTGGTAPYTYSWSNGGTSANQTNLPTGTYNVTITDNAGCSIVHELKVVNTVGIGNAPITIKFNVYPNPTAGNVTVEADLGSYGEATIQIFNTVGALVKEQKLPAQAQVRETVDLSAQANGVYLVKVTANGTTGIQRLVLNR